MLLTLFSSFGQTFLISLFVPHLLETFALDPAQFGLIYALATLASAASLPFFGHLIDRMPLQRFSLMAGLGLVLACLTVALAPNIPVLFAGILGLRLTGQGLLSLTASTTMARTFADGRGRALSMSALGYPLGEGLLPLAIAALIHATGWRMSWGILGGFIALVLLPAMNSLTIGDKGPPRLIKAPAQPAISRPRLMLFRDWRFYALLPSNLFLPLALTALFLYQVLLAEERGWPAQTMATAFIGFAVARMSSSVMIGPLIDRFSATRLLPAVLLPATAGLFWLWAGESPFTPFAYLLLAGTSQGIAGPIMTSLWAEIYGVASLGQTKGTVAALAIFATALGPLLVGMLLGMGIDFSLLVPAAAVTALGITTLNFAMRIKLPSAECDYPDNPGAMSHASNK
ncbi:MAG: MFS transporter [Desulfurivibrionaceae bacterium]|nr:MFS transporter [Desulfurivibrionaceae bacterium]